MIVETIVSALLAVTISITTYETKQLVTTVTTQGELHQEYAKPSIIFQTDILRRIYQLESLSGKNDKCRDRGLFNGYGFGQNTFTWNCFNSLEEVEAKVANWFEENLKDKSLAQATCYYNTGYVHDWCPYYEKYLSLN